jgi:hypothetical protein
MTTTADCRQLLDAALTAPGTLDTRALATLAGAPADVVDEALRDFAAAHSAEALPVLTTLTSERASRDVRRAAKRALYRLAQRGVAAPPPPPPRPIVEREAERATRAWVSGIDGTGSRAAWILFQGGFGGALLCSLILSDTAGILDATGGDITKKRLERELQHLRASHGLPWVETEPARVMALVAEALALHAALGTSPPAAFARMARLFEGAGPGPADGPGGGEPDLALVDRSVQLLDLPELAGWFLDPETLQSDGLALLQSRESKLVVPDQVKAERETAVVDAVIERELTPDVRRRWAHRLGEMALILRATDRPEPASIADAAAAALADDARDPRRHPFARELARRGVEAAAQVTLGQTSMAEVSRKPTPIQPPAES